jgi:putative intracellular protease/amidase
MSAFGLRVRAAWLLTVLCVGCPPAAWPQEQIDLPTRPGITQPIYLTVARNPIASAVLFPGGSGVVSAVRNNFLIRVTGQFAAAGVTVAVADAPSDHAWGLDVGVRASEAQAADAAAIVAFLRSRAAVPVWLIGTSNGSISAANAGVRLGPPSIAGVVLTSSVWAGGMSMVPLNNLRVPVLIVHNREDTCRTSPFAQAEKALDVLSTAPAKQFIAVSSDVLRGNPCEALSPHGYFGIEVQVVPPIVGWIKTH